MCYFILPQSGRVISRTTVGHLTKEELNDPDVQRQLRKFDRKLAQKIGGANKKVLTGDWKGGKRDLDQQLDDEYPEMVQQPDWELPEDDEFTPEAYDNLLSAKVQLPLAGELKRGTVVNRKRDANGNPVGIRDDNPLLDTRMYKVEFSNGDRKSVV